MTEPTARRDAAEWGEYVTDGHTYEPANLPTYSKPTDRDAAVLCFQCHIIREHWGPDCDPCIKPKGHGGVHRSAEGIEWNR